MVVSKNTSIDFPKLSVIVPCYNVSSTILQCIGSITDQTYRNLEIICVDDGSSDDTLLKLNSIKDSRVKIMLHEKNKGLFHARMTGVRACTGDYIAFVDSDDYISIDYYRSLITTALLNETDITMSTIVHDHNGDLYVHNSYLNYNFPTLRGNQVFDKYLEQEGYCFAWHTVWNKIYSKKIWELALPHLEKQSKHLIMAEDVVFSSILYYFAKSFTYVPYAYYYYVKNESASTHIDANVEKYRKNIADLAHSFSFVEQFFKKVNISETQCAHFIEWKKLYVRFWTDNIKNGLEKRSTQNILYDFLKKSFNVTELEFTSKKDHYFYKATSKWDNRYADLQTRIVKGPETIISFDIFDTLLLRPFYEPSDLFRIVDFVSQHKIPRFHKLRIESEKRCREKNKELDVTLDEIYDELREYYKLDKADCDLYKKTEVDLELKYAYPRKSMKNIFEMVKYIGKRIIAISDFYMDANQIKSLLSKSEYDIDEIYVSAEYKTMKQNGALFETVVKKIGAKYSEILHIGDNWHSDKIQAEMHGMSTWFYPKALDAFMYRISDIDATHIVNVLDEPFGEKYNESKALQNLGFRCALAISANEIYDYPYIVFTKGEEFGANSKLIGYFALGTYILGISQWLIKMTRNKYETIHFVARDGYLPMKAYEILRKESDSKTNYIHMSRKSMMPLKIERITDVCRIIDELNTDKIDCESIVKIFEPILKEDSKIELKTITTIEELIKLLSENIDLDRLTKYRSVMRCHFENIIKEKDCLFDIGYSGRAQLILSNLLNRHNDAFYIHTINGDYIEELYANNIQIETYYDYTPSIVGGVREIILSSTAPSCIGYDLNKKGQPIFENIRQDYCGNFIISLIQEYALDFCKDYNRIFGEIIEIMQMRPHDVSIPFEMYVNNSTWQDRHILSPFSFEDNVYYGNDQDWVKRWDDAICYYRLRPITEGITNWTVSNKKEDRFEKMSSSLRNLFNKIHKRI